MRCVMIPVDLMRSPDWIDANLEVRDAWLTMMCHCAEQMNGGVIKDCRKWTAGKFIKVIGVESEVLKSKTQFWTWIGDDLVISKYDPGAEDTHRVYVDRAKAAARARWSSQTNGNHKHA